jgi:hypothetical protein
LQYKGETLWEENEDSLPEIVVQNRHAEQIEKRLIKALHYVQEHGFITNGIYRQLTGVTDSTMFALFGKEVAGKDTMWY